MAALHPLAVQHAAPAAAALGSGQLAANDAAIRALVPTVFHEHWWLDAVTDRRWQAAEVRDGGRLAGWMPYVLSRHRGFAVSVMPPLTHLLGPAVDEGSGGEKTRWLRRHGILRELAAQLPDVSLFSQTFHPAADDLLAFQSLGFESFVQYSASIDAADEGAMWSGMRDKVRNVVRRAQERYGVDPLPDPHEFARFYTGNLDAAGLRSWFDASLLPPLFEAAHSRRQSVMLAARTEEGRLAAAVMYVWDRQRLWYFLSSRDERLATNGAVSLLVWRGMQLAAERRLQFDFDGIASEGAARFYAGFGARFAPRFAVYRRSIRYALFTSALDALRGRRNRNTFVAP